MRHCSKNVEKHCFTQGYLSHSNDCSLRSSARVHPGPTRVQLARRSFEKKKRLLKCQNSTGSVKCGFMRGVVIGKSTGGIPLECAGVCTHARARPETFEAAAPANSFTNTRRCPLDGGGC